MRSYDHGQAVGAVGADNFDSEGAGNGLFARAPWSVVWVMKLSSGLNIRLFKNLESSGSNTSFVRIGCESR